MAVLSKTALQTCDGTEELFCDFWCQYVVFGDCAVDFR